MFGTQSIQLFGDDPNSLKVKIRIFEAAKGTRILYKDDVAKALKLPDTSLESLYSLTKTLRVQRSDPDPAGGPLYEQVEEDVIVAHYSDGDIRSPLWPYESMVVQYRVLDGVILLARRSVRSVTSEHLDRRMLAEFHALGEIERLRIAVK